MNYRMVFYILGQIVRVEGLLLLIPLLCAVLYGESEAYPAFLIPMFLTLAIGTGLTLKKPKNREMNAREGFVSVGLSWVLLSLFGMLPYLLSGSIASPIDAFFETVSGFTTTGATILPDIESLGRGVLLWRDLTHWIGGMGVLVFVLAIMPQSDLKSARLMHVMRAEVSGPKVGKLVATLKHTARITYGIYIALTVVMFLLLLPGGMSIYEALLHAFGTAGTGGFSCMNDSLASYGPYVQWVVMVFMFLFSLNFTLFYLILIGRARQALRSEELWWFTGIVLVSGAAIACNIYSLYGNVGDAVRHAYFQVASILSTTGFATADFNLWPNFSRTLLFLLMFVGGCAGSTAGGLKVSRLMILVKSSIREIRYLLHPRAVAAVHFEGKPLDNETIRSSLSYFIIFSTAAALSVVLFTLSDRMPMEVSVSAVVSALNNVGPALGESLGPVGNFSSVTVFGKLLLSLNMLLGRLEIFPILVLFFPSVWKNR